MDRRTTAMLKADELMCTGVNFIRKIEYIFFNKKSILRKNNVLKDNKNNTCFILGNGPSINKVDLSKIAKYDSFTVNHFYNGDKNFESTYHVIIDPAFGKIENKYAYELIIKKTKKTKILANIDFYNTVNNYEDSIRNRVSYIYPLYVANGKNPKIDICKPMTGSLNIVPFVIECAISMGYKKIYLLGCDFSFYIKRGGFYEHFYSKETRNTNNIINYEAVRGLVSCSLVQKQHFEISDIAKKNNAEIINLSDGSLIEAYCVEDFDTVINNLNN